MHGDFCDAWFDLHVHFVNSSCMVSSVLRSRSDWFLEVKAEAHFH